MLKLAPMWEHRHGVAAWYERMRARPSFQTAVEAWMSPRTSNVMRMSRIHGRRCAQSCVLREASAAVGGG
jgi:hypothetical protein